MNATTAYRHFWLDRALQAIAFIPLGLLIDASGGVILAVAAANWVIASFAHLNLGIGFRNVPWLVVTPQFHRVHHSLYQEHYDRNFANFLPLWDVLFGTYLKPEGFPATGLTEGEPGNLRETLMWPFVSHRSLD